MLKFPLRQAVHQDPDQSPSGGPASGGQVSLAGTGQHETAGCRPLIDGPLNRPKHLGPPLPLIDQQREGAIGQSGVRIRAYNCSLSRPVQPEPLLAMSATRGRLAAGTRAYDQDGGVIS